MIAKRIEFRNVNLSSFKKLVNYITNAQGKNERVGEIRVTNFQSEHPTWAAIEAEGIQDKNKRTQIDKTYHLLLSFREGDYPSAETRHAIEQRICDKLGFGEHQRISAVHYDTDHMHIHIAINKIHPTRFTAHEPYFDKKNLGVLCDVLEKEYGLAVDNHIPRMTEGEARAQDMERSAGVESLIGWIKRGCLTELLEAATWEEMHRVLARNGLQLTERGNGLVIKDSQGIAVKPSSIARALSKNVLEKKLGEFRPCVAQEVKIERRYEIKPVASKIDTKELWKLYQRERDNHKQRHEVLKERAKHRKERRVEIATKNANAQRSLIKLTKGKIAKTLLYKAASDSFLKEMRTIHNDYKADTRTVYEKGKHVVWYDWLKAKAWEGNAQALEVLRHRYDRAHVNANTIGGEAIDRVNYLHGAKIEAVTKRGTVHYQVAQTVLRDDGKEFRLAEKVSPEVVKTALRLASQRFGSELSISGTEEFRRQVAELAAQTNMKLSFTAPEMEAQRKQYIEATVTPPAHSKDAADIYIQERNEKRKQGIEDILPHRRYREQDAGKLPFAGLRQVEGKTLMLLQTPSETLVLPIDGKSLRRVKKLKIGKPVDVNTQGIVRSRSRGRSLSLKIELE